MNQTREQQVDGSDKRDDCTVQLFDEKLDIRPSLEFRLTQTATTVVMTPANTADESLQI
jgi:hypothetical protein